MRFSTILTACCLSFVTCGCDNKARQSRQRQSSVVSHVRFDVILNEDGRVIGLGIPNHEAGPASNRYIWERDRITVSSICQLPEGVGTPGSDPVFILAEACNIEKKILIGYSSRIEVSVDLVIGDAKRTLQTLSGIGFYEIDLKSVLKQEKGTDGI